MPTVANPPAKALIVFDGDCHFCTQWVRRWGKETGDLVDYAPFQEQAERFPEVPRAGFESEVKLILPDARVFGGAEAVFRCLNLAVRPAPLARLGLWMYRHAPGFKWVSEAGYKFVAEHRQLASAVTRWVWGNEV